MARRDRRQGGNAGTPHDSDAGATNDELSTAVVESLLQDGYTVGDIAAFYGLPVRRIRRFLKRHGIDEPSDTTAGSAWMGDDGDIGAGRASTDRLPWPDPGPPRVIGAGAGKRRGNRRPSAAEIDELCALYLDPSISLDEVAAYADLDPETALELINGRLTGIL